MAELTGAEMHDLGDRLVGAIAAGDTEGVRAIYAPDAEIWHNFDERNQSVDENVASMADLHGRASGLAYTEIRRFLAPGGFVQQHVLRATLPNGGTWELPACVIVRVRDGLIVRLDEYLDSAHVAKLTEALTGG